MLSAEYLLMSKIFCNAIFVHLFHSVSEKYTFLIDFETRSPWLILFKVLILIIWPSARQKRHHLHHTTRQHHLHQTSPEDWSWFLIPTQFQQMDGDRKIFNRENCWSTQSQNGPFKNKIKDFSRDKDNVVMIQAHQWFNIDVSSETETSSKIQHGLWCTSLMCGMTNTILI